MSEAIAERTFAQLGVPPRLAAVLTGQGIVTPTPIQTATLPDTLAGRDVLGDGRTGSGKTIAFAVPMVAALAASGTPRNAGRPRALVLVPTRELATQVAATVGPLATSVGLRCTTVFGGVGQHGQAKALREGVDILVACPGRLEDLIGQGLCALDRIEITVLDEADHMADLGFLPAVKRLLDRTPAGTQRMLFSATLDQRVDGLVRRYLRNPVTHSVNPPVASIGTMEHHVLAVRSEHKNAVVHELSSGLGRTLMFTRTKHGAKRLVQQLSKAGVPAVDLHGNLSQRARERNLAAFSSGEVRVLVATDIAARGIHVDDIGLVVHVDPPAEHKAYLHRSGRTARAGSDGIVVTVMTPDQRGDVRALTRQAGIQVEPQDVTSGHPAILALTGPHAALEYRAIPESEAAPAVRRRPSTPAARSRPTWAGGTSRSSSRGRRR